MTLTICLFFAAVIVVVAFVSLIGWLVEKIEPEEDGDNEDLYGEENW